MKKIKPDDSIDKKYFKYLTAEWHGIYGKKYFDSRTKNINGIPHVYPVGFNKSQVIIVCPYCHKLHYHGLCDGDYDRNRTAHCSDEAACKINSKGYYIEIG
jgi:hypothetical protein